MTIEQMEIKKRDKSELNLDELKESLIMHICTENKAFFKSQQKDEDEINFDERKTIVENMLNSSHTKFLSRFGMHMEKKHLKFFEDSNEEIIIEQIKNLTYNLDHKKVLVRNRRYAAMMKLINENSYFSENEMKQRDPLLYEQLIGQYLTSEEKRMKRRPNATCDTLIDILFEGIDYDHNLSVEKEQRKSEEQQNIDEESQSVKSDSDDDSNEPESDRKQWGNFEDSQSKEHEISPSTSRAKKRAAQLITAGERDVLKEEFVGIMYNNFLSGKDVEFFDYSQVDNNEQYDETIEHDQDCEDKYFDEEDSQNSDVQEKMENSDASEDELDIYMKHIEDNLKRQKDEAFQEEFDD